MDDSNPEQVRAGSNDSIVLICTVLVSVDILLYSRFFGSLVVYLGR